MRLTFLLATAAAVLIFAALVHDVRGDESAEKAAQVILLKLDDVTADTSQTASPVPPRWQRITDFLKESNIKASFGIIGFSLEEDNQAYFDWIKTLHDSGLIEFWNHGHRNRKGTDPAGEFEGAFEPQQRALLRTQQLAKEKLGIELRVFGAHWSGTNANTARALKDIAEIKACYYDPAGADKFVFERVLTLENPTHVCDFAKFQAAYERVGRDKPCLALQGHPNSWDDGRWESFVKIIDYLKSKGCVFMKPSEYLEKLSKATPKPEAR